MTRCPRCKGYLAPATDDHDATVTIWTCVSCARPWRLEAGELVPATTPATPGYRPAARQPRTTTRREGAA